MTAGQRQLVDIWLCSGSWTERGGHCPCLMKRTTPAEGRVCGTRPSQERPARQPCLHEVHPLLLRHTNPLPHFFLSMSGMLLLSARSTMTCNGLAAGARLVGSGHNTALDGGWAEACTCAKQDITLLKKASSVMAAGFNGSQWCGNSSSSQGAHRDAVWVLVPNACRLRLPLLCKQQRGGDLGSWSAGCLRCWQCSSSSSCGGNVHIQLINLSNRSCVHAPNGCSSLNVLARGMLLRAASPACSLRWVSPACSNGLFIDLQRRSATNRALTMPCQSSRHVHRAGAGEQGRRQAAPSAGPA